MQTVLFSSHGLFIEPISSVNYTSFNSIKIFLLDKKLIYICIFNAK